MPRVVKREAAKRDLIRHFAYLGQNASLKVARRFAAAARTTFESLARMPEMGISGKVRKGKFGGVRLWPISGFANYLIAYHPLKDGIQVERVFHAAQDYERILNMVE